MCHRLSDQLDMIETRRTYRAVFSEPTVILPQASQPAAVVEDEGESVAQELSQPTSDTDKISGKKRARDEEVAPPVENSAPQGPNKESLQRKKKKAKVPARQTGS